MEKLSASEILRINRVEHRQFLFSIDFPLLTISVYDINCTGVAVSIV